MRLSQRVGYVVVLILVLIAASVPAFAAEGSQSRNDPSPLGPPECRGGASEDDSPPSGPNTSGNAGCKAQPKTKTKKDKRPRPHPGDHWVGVQTNGYFSTGAYGALNVVNPGVRRGTNDYLSQRILSKTCDNSRWLEIGWAEVGWRDDKQYIYTYSSADHQWRFYDQYPISWGSRIYVELYRVGDGWDAYLWWNGGWHLLYKAPWTDLTCTESYVEPNSSTSSGHFPSPTIRFGDGGSGGFQIADSNGAFRTWDASIPSSESNDDGTGYYKTVWRRKYWDFDVTSNNSPPNVSLSTSPGHGDVSTYFSLSASASDPDGDSSQCCWIYWGDGSSSHGTSASHRYSDIGKYQITVNAYDEWGARGSASRIVEVCASLTSTGACNHAPVSSMTVSKDTVTTDQPITVDLGASFDPDGDAITSEIDWGDGSVTANNKGEHSFPMAGEYTISGVVTDQWGIRSTATRRIQVCAGTTTSPCAQSPSHPSEVTSPEGAIDFVAETYGTSGGPSAVGSYAAAVMEAREQLGIPDQAENLTREQHDAVRKLADELLLNWAEENTRGEVQTLNGVVDEVEMRAASILPDAYDQMNSKEKRVCRNNPWDCWRSRDTHTDAVSWQAKKYPRQPGHNDKGDAFRHCMWSALMTKRANEEFAREFGNAHEYGATNQPRKERDMDLHNNRIGRNVGYLGEEKSDAWIADVCKMKAETKQLIISLNDRRLG